MSGQETKKEQDQGRSIAEWITLTISTVIVLSLVGLIVYEYVGRSNQPPEIIVDFQRGQVRKENDSYSIPVVITNRGEQTATNVRILVSLGTGNQADQSEIQIDFLAGGAHEQRRVVVRQDPAQMDFRVVSISFAVP